MFVSLSSLHHIIRVIIGCAGWIYLTACSTMFFEIAWAGSSGDVTMNQNETLGVWLHTTMLETLEYKTTIFMKHMS